MWCKGENVTRSKSQNPHTDNQPALLDAEDIERAADEVLAALTTQGVTVANAPEVAAYLAGHPDLADVVPSVGAQARKEFGKDAQLSLRLYRDPEIDDRYLSLNVRLLGYDDHTMERIDRVSEPFDEQLCNASGYLLVTTDFRAAQAKS
jgi:hypothetical protein